MRLVDPAEAFEIGLLPGDFQIIMPRSMLNASAGSSTQMRPRAQSRPNSSSVAWLVRWIAFL